MSFNTTENISPAQSVTTTTTVVSEALPAASLEEQNESTVRNALGMPPKEAGGIPEPAAMERQPIKEYDLPIIFPPGTLFVRHAINDLKEKIDRWADVNRVSDAVVTDLKTLLGI